MSDLKVRVNETIVLISDHDDKVLWQLPLAELPAKIIHECLSRWVLFLSREGWVTLDALYRLAEIIETNCPDNIIDWEWTFALVEAWFDNKQISVREMQNAWIQVSYQEKRRIEEVVF